jgi:hypothetical protein
VHDGGQFRNESTVRPKSTDGPSAVQKTAEEGQKESRLNKNRSRPKKHDKATEDSSSPPKRNSDPAE